MPGCRNGSRGGLKILWTEKVRAGSSPAPGTRYSFADMM